MEVSVVHKSLEIDSYKGKYSLEIKDNFTDLSGSIKELDNHFIVDSKVAHLYKKQLKFIDSGRSKYLIDANEDNKSIEKVIPIFRHLVDHGVKRNHTIVAIGGGITQDIACFIASTLLRGIDWTLIPTTLLAQADSCIGSKSSINLGETKNIIGTFNPPKKILLSTLFLETLETKDINSGIGEMIKVHAIDGPTSFDSIAKDFDGFLENFDLIKKYIFRSLKIKKRYIEKDEFDKGVRNIFNYGHSFGHAIESATNFSIPHGIAITIGMDMANQIALDRGLIDEKNYLRMSTTLSKNYSGYSKVSIGFKSFYQALLKDKKNTSTHLALILPIGKKVEIKKHMIEPDQIFSKQCQDFIARFG